MIFNRFILYITDFEIVVCMLLYCIHSKAKVDQLIKKQLNKNNTNKMLNINN